MALDLSQFVPDWATAGKILGGPATGAVVGWLLARKQRKTADAQASADQTNAITTRFKALMDGYENRIDDLVAEVAHLRGQVAELQEQLNNRAGFGQ